MACVMYYCHCDRHDDPPDPFGDVVCEVFDVADDVEDRMVEFPAQVREFVGCSIASAPIAAFIIFPSVSTRVRSFPCHPQAIRPKFADAAPYEDFCIRAAPDVDVRLFRVQRARVQICGKSYKITNMIYVVAYDELRADSVLDRLVHTHCFRPRSALVRAK